MMFPATGRGTGPDGNSHSSTGAAYGPISTGTPYPGTSVAGDSANFYVGTPDFYDIYTNLPNVSMVVTLANDYSGNNDGDLILQILDSQGNEIDTGNGWGGVVGGGWVVLPGPSSALPPVTLPSPGVYYIEITGGPPTYVTDDIPYSFSVAPDHGLGVPQIPAPPTVVVSPLAPIAANVGVPVTFNASGSSDPSDPGTLTYAWTFDDRAMAAGPVATYAFATTGKHTATVTVTAPSGMRTILTETVTVTPPPPEITRLRLASTDFRRGTSLARASGVAPSGTTISFALSERASVTLSFAHVIQGRLSNGHCVAGTQSLKRAQACTRLVALPENVPFASLRAGTRHIGFDGELDDHSLLRPGRYQLTLVAQNANGKSEPASRRFTLNR
jgi:hypothetical protein